MRVRSIALWGGDYDGQTFEVDKDLDVRSRPPLREAFLAPGSGSPLDNRHSKRASP